MKKKILSIVFILIAICSVAFFLIPGHTEISNNPISIEQRIKNKMDSMTLEQKIAQMIILYYSGDAVDDSLRIPY